MSNFRGTTAGSMEVSWNPSQVCVDLQLACQILSDRCLTHAAKFAAEQWMGLPPETIEADHSGIEATIAAADYLNTERNPAVVYANSLLELGEFAHAAARLSETSLSNKAASIETMAPPQADLSPKAIYLRAYSLYLAGERRKEEDILQQQR